MKAKSKGTTPSCILTLVVTFENDIDQADVERIVDEARSYGHVMRATFERTQHCVIELVPVTEFSR